MGKNDEHTKETIQEKVVEIVMDVLALDADDAKITSETRFVEDLGAESLDMAQFVMSLEDEFQESIDDQQLMGLKSIQDAVDFIHKQFVEPNE